MDSSLSLSSELLRTPLPPTTCHMVYRISMDFHRFPEIILRSFGVFGRIQLNWTVKSLSNPTTKARDWQTDPERSHRIPSPAPTNKPTTYHVLSFRIQERRPRRSSPLRHSCRYHQQEGAFFFNQAETKQKQERNRRVWRGYVYGTLTLDTYLMTPSLLCSKGHGLSDYGPPCLARVWNLR